MNCSETSLSSTCTPLRSRIHRKSSARQAFSLIEILIVIALIGALATLVITNVGGLFSGQQERIAKQFVSDAVRLPLIAYYRDVGTYPSTEQGLQALIRAPEGTGARWRGPYLEVSSVPLDPWNNPYQYRFPGEKNINGPRGYDIWSFGPDGVPSENDIGNWD